MKGVEKEIRILRNLRSGPTRTERKVGTAYGTRRERTPKRKEKQNGKRSTSSAVSTVRPLCTWTLAPLPRGSHGRKFWIRLAKIKWVR